MTNVVHTLDGKDRSILITLFEQYLIYRGNSPYGTVYDDGTVLWEFFLEDKAGVIEHMLRELFKNRVPGFGDNEYADAYHEDVLHER